MLLKGFRTIRKSFTPRRRLINIKKRRYSSSPSYVNIQYVDKIAILQMNRPKVNAMDDKFFIDIVQSMKTVEQNKNVKGIILTGLPGIFSAGLDIPFLLSLSREKFNEWYINFIDGMAAFCGSKLPTIAAISGHAPAGGCVFAIMCDYRIMANGPFTIGLNEVPVGIIIPQSIIELIRNTIGNRKAELQALTGKMWTPQEAKEIGLIDEHVEPDQLIPRSIAFMKETFIPVYNPAFIGTKQIIRKPYLDGLQKQKQDPQFTNLFFDPIMRSNLEAFVSKLKKK